MPAKRTYTHSKRGTANISNTVYTIIHNNIVNYHTEESIDRLKKNLEKQKKAIEEGNIVKFIDYDDQFHSIMFDETRKHLCYRVIQSFSSHYRRIRYLSMYISDVSKSNIEQHQQLVDAVAEHDAVKANAVLKKHIRKLILEKDEICEKYPEYFQQEELFIDDIAVFDGHNELEQLMSDTSILSM